MKLTKQQKGILSLIGGFCLHFMNGSLYTWSAINPYFASYLHHFDESIEEKDLFFLMPCIFLVQYCFMTAGVKLGDNIGPRFTTLFAVIIMVGSYSILITCKKLPLILLGMGIFGLGDGIGNLSVIKNCWRYYPNNKGLVNGIIIGGLGISSAILNPIADKIINPHAEEKIHGFYDYERVAKRLIYFLYTLVGIFAFLGTCAVLFTFPYEEEEEQECCNPELECGRLRTAFKCNCSNCNEIGEALLTLPNLYLGACCFCGPFSNTNRAFGGEEGKGSGPKVSQKALQLMAIFYSLINGGSRFIWGLLMDKLGFKILLAIILCVEVVVSATFYYSKNTVATYFIDNFLVALCLSGTFTMITPEFNKVFGNKNGPDIYGITGILIGIASFLGPVLTKVLLKELKHYKICYWVGGIFAVINMVALYFYDNTKPYEYKTSRLSDLSGKLVSDESSIDVSDHVVPDKKEDEKKEEEKNEETKQDNEKTEEVAVDPTKQGESNDQVQAENTNANEENKDVAEVTVENKSE